MNNFFMRSIAASTLLIASTVLANTGSSSPISVENCVSTKALTADAQMTLSQLRALCEQIAKEGSLEEVKSPIIEEVISNESAGVLQTRIVSEALNRSSRFVLTPHRRNFFIPAVYHREPNTEPYVIAGSNLQHLRHTEAELQLSVKILMRENIFNGNGHLYFAYTNYSLWQLYSEKDSAPFRGTDHTPEAFISFYNDWNIWGFKNTLNSIGFAHQSNGQGGTLSRSWNRIFAQSIFERDNLVLAFTPYYRIPESKKKDPFDKNGDDNPDLVDYLGHLEVSASYKFDNKILSLTTRNIVENTNRATFDLSFSFPISTNIRGVARYFNGYGYSLIDYNSKQEAFGVGILFTDIF